ncbi:MAG: ABC transporter ATP-binding protein [Verrucomicrobiales bacterium]|nr:ABC transporter ATP-binding protein [Verrucomicrobiales bacterium]
MTSPTPAIAIQGLVRRFGKTEAVHGLDLTVPAGTCYGFFGRNGAGKTTTIKCLLNLLRPDAGSVRVFGLDPAKDELEVKRRLAYVPDQVAFYPWMTAREALDYSASFRSRWNTEAESDLLNRFRLDAQKPVSGLSKGQRTQLALIAAICAEPELLVLDEPTSGLDPIVRREFIEAVIGAYQDADPGRRTVFVSTHLISEFEGLIDRFTIIENGKATMTLDADEARSKFRKVRVRFTSDPPRIDLPGVLKQSRKGREVELVTNGATEQVVAELQRFQPEDVSTEALSLEEIFVVADQA